MFFLQPTSTFMIQRSFQARISFCNNRVKSKSWMVHSSTVPFSSNLSNLMYVTEVYAKNICTHCRNTCILKLPDTVRAAVFIYMLSMTLVQVLMWSTYQGFNFFLPYKLVQVVYMKVDSEHNCRPKLTHTWQSKLSNWLFIYNKVHALNQYILLSTSNNVIFCLPKCIRVIRICSSFLSTF